MLYASVMRIFLLLTIGLALSAQSTDEYFHIMGGFLKGGDYLELSERQRAAYAEGFVNGMSIAAIVLNVDSSKKEPKWLTDCTRDMTNVQIAEIIRKHIQDNPAQWHLGLNTLGYNAMLAACSQYAHPEK